MNKTPQNIINQIVQDYQNGLSPKTIGEKYNLRSNSISRILRKQSIKKTQLKRLNKKIEKDVIKLYLSGQSSPEIGKIFNINASSVIRILQRNNINKSMRETFSLPAISTNLSKSSDPANYATIYHLPYKDKQLNKETVQKLSLEEKDEAAIIARDYFRKNGFPYPLLTDDELIHSFTSLKNINPNSISVEDHILRTDNQAGTNIIKHFSPHFFETNSGKSKKLNLIDTFNDDELLLKVIQNRLRQGYHINGNMLRQGLNTSKVAYKASIFNTVIAKYIYSQYTKENDIVYDYSMGFGQRLLASLSLPYHIKYIGVDVLAKSVSSNQEIFNYFNSNVPMLNKETKLYCQGSEHFCPEELQGKISLAFSSPPYFNLELYDKEDPNQACNKSYNSFLNEYWKGTVSNITKMLKRDGVFILNINDEVSGFNIGEDMSNMIKSFGFELIKTYKMQLSKNLKFANKTGKHKYEPIYVFQKV